MRSFITTLTILIVTLTMTSTSTAQIVLGTLKKGDTRITIYDEANFAGTSATFDVPKKGCTSVPTNLNDKISSISFFSKTHTDNQPNCVLGFREHNCQGTRYVLTDVTPCLNNLADPNCNFDNAISSFKSCEEFFKETRG